MVYTYVKVRCLPAAELTKLPGLLLLLSEGEFPTSVTLKLKQRSSPSDMFISAVYLVIMTVLHLPLHVFSKKEEKNMKIFIPSFLFSSIT